MLRLRSNWIIHRHHQPLTFCISLITQETQTQLLLCPGGVEWSEAASSCGALWGWIPAALCPGEGGDCQDTQPWPRANQGAFPGHPQTGAERPKGRNKTAFIVLTSVWGIIEVMWWYGCTFSPDVQSKEKTKETWLMESEILFATLLDYWSNIVESFQHNCLHLCKCVRNISSQDKSLECDVCSPLVFNYIIIPNKQSFIKCDHV